MKIRKIELYSVKLHLRSTLRLSFGEVKHSKNIILRIHTTDDVVGVGEIAPSIHESFESALLALDRIVPKLKGLDIGDIGSVVHLMERRGCWESYRQGGN